MMTVLHNVLSLRCFVLSVALVCAGCGSSENNDRSGSDLASRSALDSTAAEFTADSMTIELLGSDSVSVFDLLVAGHEVDHVSSGAGVFVKAIDSIANSTGHYWLYSVNDSMAQVAADKYLTSDGDRIVWHYRRAGK